ncbi:Glycosyl transferases group 1 [Lacunisphaera limnophila]|uniref:Glycosyl transferases group 1 n=1 Tax=Lacunisphaera limnophila TaxID=1838286 RepID=A0A1D8ATF9_9BACT|nr:glycosyltransferase [Lacunisphaera limnophila]AOS44150.1 Glycosyl transferases group 1 [Lacunisphaera limnophila]
MNPAPSLTVTEPLRLLLLLGQSPFDPTSGAAQSMRQIALALAVGGAQVRGLSTTACEGDPGIEPAELMRAAGADVIARSGGWRARLGGVEFDLVPVAQGRARQWEKDVGRLYAARLEELTKAFRPQVVLTFGGDPTDAARRRRLRVAGARVVFALHNLAYLKCRPEAVDAFLAPTRFLAARYEAAWGEPIAVLPPPLDPGHVVAAKTEPVCLGFCNPEPAKGVALVAHLAHRLGRERPEVPLLVIGGRAPASALVDAGRRLGFDLTGFPNLLQAVPVARPADLWGACRGVLMPSVVEEAAGRVPLEAMANGAVPLVAERGGLPELVGAAGVVLPLPASLTLQDPWTVPPETVEMWWSALTRLVDDEVWWRERSAVARAAAARFLVPAVVAEYTAWFTVVARRVGKEIR